MIYGEDGEILHECAAAPYVEDLDAEADGEDGLVEVVCILEEELIDVFAGRVGGGALGNWVLAVLLGIDVGGAAGRRTAWQVLMRLAISTGYR